MEVLRSGSIFKLILFSLFCFSSLSVRKLSRLSGINAKEVLGAPLLVVTGLNKDRAVPWPHTVPSQTHSQSQTHSREDGPGTGQHLIELIVWASFDTFHELKVPETKWNQRPLSAEKRTMSLNKLGLMSGQFNHFLPSGKSFYPKWNSGAHLWIKRGLKWVI